MATTTLEFVDVSGLEGRNSEEVFARLFALSGKGKILVGWKIGRQVQDWVDFLPEGALERLAKTGMVRRQGKRGNYCLRYIPNRLFDVAAIPDRDGTPHTYKGKRAKVYDLSHWFGCPLEEALSAWKCSDLRALANCLRASLASMGIKPSAWYGPGPVAGQLMRKHKVSEHNVPPRDNPEGMENLFRRAYYGGRIQAVQVGACGHSLRYDLRSAYAAAMVRLPSLDGEWWQGTGCPPWNDSLCLVSWSTPEDCDLTPFPWRGDDGHISYPREGRGWYWGSLVKAAKRGPWSVKIEEAWHLSQYRATNPFAYLEGFHQSRLMFGEEPEAGLLKGILVSSYGKLIQHGAHYPNKHASMAWAGMVTAQVQAWLLEAALQAPGRVVSFLTDCLMLTGGDPLDLPLGPQLGQWAESRMDGLWVFQPAFYVTACYRHEILASNSDYTLHAAGAPDDQMLARRAAGQWLASGLYGKVRFSQSVYCGMAMALLRGWDKWRTTLNVEQEMRLRPLMGFPGELGDNRGGGEIWRWDAWTPGRDYSICSLPYCAHGEGLVDDRWAELEAIRAAEEC